MGAKRHELYFSERCPDWVLSGERGTSRVSETLRAIYESLSAETSLHSDDELADWFSTRDSETKMEVRRITLSQSAPWFYDREHGSIRNRDGSFFSITGIEKKFPGGETVRQPVIVQDEIGFLGLLCREIDGVMHFLIQAKAEPGNVKLLQLSPTLQATRSNFTCRHGGAEPPYLQYFRSPDRCETVADQLQSEQAARFYMKRNRNMILRVEDAPELATHRWMTLRQLAGFLRCDNLVNMDLRTVLSCIPFWELGAALRCGDDNSREFDNAYGLLNSYKMLKDTPARLIPLWKLPEWSLTDTELSCLKPAPFKIIFCQVTAEGREVHQWTQPLAAPVGWGTLALVQCCGERPRYLVRLTAEPGSRDGVEFGPTIQREPVRVTWEPQDAVSRLVEERMKSGHGVLRDVLLSEEGGRFYQEENRNVLLSVDETDLPPLPEDCALMEYSTLNRLVQSGGAVNIQLRNLLTLLLSLEDAGKICLDKGSI